MAMTIKFVPGKGMQDIPRRGPTNGHGCYLERKADGDIVYHMPYKSRAERGPMKHTAPKPRKDTSDTLIARVTKDIENAIKKDKRKQEMTGNAAAKGYKIAATDGHRALLVLGNGSAGHPWLGDINADGYKHIATFYDPEFHLALKRARIMADERNMALIGSVPGGESGALIYSNYVDVGDFSEVVQADRLVSSSWNIWLNIDYLEVALGCWPLRMYWKSATESVVFEPANERDRTWRYVLMPVRCGCDDAREAEGIKMRLMDERRQG